MRLSQLILGLLLSTLGLTLTTNVFGQTQSFRCNFSDGISTNFDSGKPSTKRVNDMNEIVYDQLDIKKGTGRMIGNSGSENIQVIRGDGSTHIIERTSSGNLNITTIFNPTQKYSDLYPVVHSRHINLMSDPFPSQYVGLCRKLN